MSDKMTWRGKKITVNVEHDSREMDRDEYWAKQKMRESIDDMEFEENVYVLVSALGDLVNVMGSDHQKKFTTYFAKALRRQHNTLEQSLVTNLLNALFDRFDPDIEHKWVDLRNEATCEAVNRIEQLLEKDEYRLFYKGSNDHKKRLHAPLI